MLLVSSSAATSTCYQQQQPQQGSPAAAGVRGARHLAHLGLHIRGGQGHIHNGLHLQASTNKGGTEGAAVGTRERRTVHRTQQRREQLPRRQLAGAPPAHLDRALGGGRAGQGGDHLVVLAGDHLHAGD